MDHRLHDYCQLGRRILEAAELDPDEFVRQFDQLRRSTGAEIAAGDVFVARTLKLLDSLKRGAAVADKLPGWKSWFPTGAAAVRTSAGQIIVGIKPKHLIEHLRSQVSTYHSEGDWLPKNEREAAGALLRTTPIFADLGVTTNKRALSARHSYWEFEFPDDGDLAL